MTFLSSPLRHFITSSIALFMVGGATAQSEVRDIGNQDRKEINQSQIRGPAHQMPTFTINPNFDVILGRIEDRSVTVSMLSYQTEMNVKLLYGPIGKSMTGEAASTLVMATPTHLKLSNLLPNTAYEYRIISSTNSQVAGGRFHTARPSGSSFTFTVSADTHLDQNTSVPLYRQTLANVLNDQGDFILIWAIHS